MGIDRIVTWYYEQSRSEGGDYAQVRGDSSSEDFRDVYRRCVAVFFSSARRANPDAELILYLNREWRSDASIVAKQVAQTINDLRIKVHVLPYNYAPPETWAKAWRNQFFLFDVLEHLSQTQAPSQATIILDSDVIWSNSVRTLKMWNRLRELGALCYKVGYTAGHPVNGLNQAELTVLAERLGLDHRSSDVAYCGGEFVALLDEELADVMNIVRRTWRKVLDLHEEEKDFFCEEAHILSMVYAHKDYAPGTANEFVSRLWTQPFKHRNVSPSDRDLALWHLPAEKKFGLARLYGKLESESRLYSSLSDDAFRDRLGRTLGVPSNSPRKVVADVARAVRGRMK